MDERPIAIRDHGQGRAGLSPDDRFAETSGDNGETGFGVGNPQASPPKAKPRILYSGEGLRPHPPREVATTGKAWRHGTVAPASYV